MKETMNERADIYDVLAEVASIKRESRTTYLAVGRHTWGRGSSVREAIKVARSQGGTSPKYVVYLSEDPQVQLNQLGYILSDAELPAPVKVGTFNARGKALD